MFGFGSKKNPKTMPQLAALLFEQCIDASKRFCEDIQQQLANTSFEPPTKAVFSEAILMHLWISSKILTPHQGLLDSLHDCYFRWIASQAAGTDDERRALLRSAQETLHQRYRAYYDAWDEAHAWQHNLCRLILQHLLTAGRPDRRLQNASLVAHTNISLLTFMKYVAEFRGSVGLENKA